MIVTIEKKTAAEDTEQTSIRLRKTVLRAARQRALDCDTTLQAIADEALEEYLVRRGQGLALKLDLPEDVRRVLAGPSDEWERAAVSGLNSTLRMIAAYVAAKKTR